MCLLHRGLPYLIYSAVEIFEKSQNGKGQDHYVKMGWRNNPYGGGCL